MSNDANQILGLIADTGKTAAEMTNSLKNVGNGSMQNGLYSIAKYFFDEGIIRGKRIGIVQGIVLVSITAIGGITIKYALDKKKHQQEGKAIVANFSQPVADNNEVTEIPIVGENNDNIDEEEEE